MRRVRWVALLTGIALTLSLVWSLGLRLGLLFPPGIPEGAVPTGLAWYRFVIVGALRPLLSLFAIFFVGSFVVGLIATAFPGLNGVVSAVVASIVSFLWFVWGLLAWIFVTPSNPGEAYTRDENLGNLIVLSVALCAVFPIIVLAGFLGGRLGGRLRNRLATRSASRAAPGE